MASRTTVYFDERWIGDHGIGRVAGVLRRGLALTDLAAGGSPTSPLDPLRLSVRMLALPREAAVLSPGFNAPWILARPYLFIIHDLNHIDRPENSGLLKRVYYRFVLKRACRAAHRVLTVSEFSRSRIIEWSGVAAGKVINIGNGVDASFAPDGPAFDAGAEYFLCVSNRKAHKNDARAIEAFAAARLASSVDLILTGPPTPRLSRLARDLGVGDRIRFVGHVPGDHLPPLYRGAVALLFPSLYEGFGLPVLEAMACGTPVLTSTATALPEVAGDAALLVDPTSVPEIARGIERLYGDAELRATLRERGLQRARQFDWNRVVDRVRAVLDSLATE
ncbi:MAG: glycosyltransferase family 4 protein [Deltaproteobacteria bacterium]|nr:glycosyltransferase family 4 protein [Deltaproteobacteria bacterium]